MANTTCACCRQAIEGEPAGHAYVTPGVEPIAGRLLFAYGLCQSCWDTGNSSDEQAAQAVAEAVNCFHLDELAQTKPQQQPEKKKRLPAYGRELDAARRRGLVPKHQGHGHLTVNFDWRQDCAPGAVVTVPDDADPLDDLDWHFAAGLDVFVMHETADQPRLKRLVLALHKAHATKIRTFDIERAGEPGAFLDWIPRHAA